MSQIQAGTQSGRLWKAVRVTREIVSSSGTRVTKQVTPNPRRHFVIDSLTMQPSKKDHNLKWLNKQYTALEESLQTALINCAAINDVDLDTAGPSVFGESVPAALASRHCLKALESTLSYLKSKGRKDIEQIAAYEFLDGYVNKHNLQYGGFSTKDSKFFKEVIFGIVNTIHTNYKNQHGKKSPFHLNFTLESIIKPDSDSDSSSNN